MRADAADAAATNVAPQVVITSPTDGSVFAVGDRVALAAVVTDDEPGALMQWRVSAEALGDLGSGVTSSVTLGTELLVSRAGTHELVLTVTDPHGLEGSASVSVDVKASPPAPRIRIEPNAPTTDDPLLVIREEHDPDLPERYAWLVDGQPTAEASSGVAPASTRRGQVWRVVVRELDGEIQGVPAAAEVTISNARPTCAQAVLLPSSGDTTTAFTCRCLDRDDPDLADGGETIDDRCQLWDEPEGDAGGAGAALVEEVAADETGYCRFDSARTTRGQMLTCAYVPGDASDRGEAARSAAVTVGNALPPRPTAVALQPESATVEAYLTCVASGVEELVDPDGDPISLGYRWSVDDVLVEGDWTNLVLAGRLTGKGGAIRCEAFSRDGHGASQATRSVPVVVENSPPRGGSVTISVDPSGPVTEGSTLSCDAGGATDPDMEDTLTWTTTWWVNGSQVATGASLGPEHFTKGDEVTCRGVASDGTASGPELVSKNTVVIVNSAPSIGSVEVDAPTSRAGAFECTYAGWSDPDGDVEQVRWGWTADDEPVGTNAATLAAAGLTPGAEVVCRVTPLDGTTDGASVASAPVDVPNVAPSTTAPTLGPSGATVESTLTCTAGAASDADGDPVQHDIHWTVGGQRVDGQSGATFAGGFVKGHEVRCHATPRDPYGAVGAVVGSNPNVIQDTPTRIESVSLTPAEARPCDELTCAAEVVDVDDDTFIVTRTWRADGEELTSRAQTIPASELPRDVPITCTVAVTDGLTESEITTSSATVHNTPPLLGAVSIAPSAPLVGDVLGCTPEGYSDPDCDAAPSYTYRWFADGVPDPSASGATYDRAPRGVQMTCQVTPHDGLDAGPARLSNSVVVGNRAPSAPTVSLSASSPGGPRCELVVASTDDEPVTYTWWWSIGEGAFVSGPQVLGATVSDCDRLRCRADASDGLVLTSSNVASVILPFGEDCDDDNACTDDACGVSGGCANTANSVSCSDGDPCNGVEVCDEGSCRAGASVDCSGVTSPCLERACNPETGACDLAKPDGTSCSDGVLCNGSETCDSGVCEPGVGVDCSGVTSPCLEKACNPETGACDLAKPDGTSCSDGALCNGSETCDSGVCEPGVGVDCSGVTSPCLEKACNPDTGACDQAKPDGTSCSDGVLCNGSETCDSGVCEPGAVVDCSGVTSPCLEKACNPDTGACDQAKPDGTSCSDGVLCNGSETCDSGVCEPGVVVDCSGVTSPCLEKTCNPDTGACDQAKPDGTLCGGANVCDGEETCQDGACVALDPVTRVSLADCCGEGTTLFDIVIAPDGSAYLTYGSTSAGAARTFLARRDGDAVTWSAELVADAVAVVAAPSALALARAGGFWVTVATTDEGARLLRVDAAGVVQRAVTLIDEASALVVAADGYVYVGGGSGLVVAHDDEGSRVWQVTAMSGDRRVEGLALSGDTLVAVGSVAVGASRAPWIAGYDREAGDLLWETELDPLDTGELFAVDAGGDGALWVAGVLGELDDADAWLLRVDVATGSLDDEQLVGEVATGEALHALAVRADGTIVAALASGIEAATSLAEVITFGPDGSPIARSAIDVGVIRSADEAPDGAWWTAADGEPAGLIARFVEGDACDDASDCTRDVCDEVTGCHHVEVADGSACERESCGPASCDAGSCTVQVVDDAAICGRSGWSFIRNSCMRVYEQPGDWLSAQHTCMLQHEANLAAFEDRDEWQAFAQRCLLSGPAWLGGLAPDGGADWRWASAEPWTDAPWASGEPTGEAGSCLVGDAGSSWTSEACDGSRPRFVCELPIEPCRLPWAVQLRPDGSGSNFGIAVAWVGGFVVVGAPRANVNVSQPSSNRVGAVHVFELGASAATSVQTAKVLGTQADGKLGQSVAASSSWVVAGAPEMKVGELVEAGSAFVYPLGATGTLGAAVTLQPTDPTAAAQFGGAVAIHGDVVAVGARFATAGGTAWAGAVYLFERGGASWSQIAKLEASDAATNDGFGRSLALAGDLLLVGAPSHDGDGAEAGLVYVFERDADGDWVETGVIRPTAPWASANFGLDVGLDGPDLVIGAPGNKVAPYPLGAAYVFRRVLGGAWEQRAVLTVDASTLAGPPSTALFGTTVAIRGGMVVTGDRGLFSGSGAGFLSRIDPLGGWIQTYNFASDGGYSYDMAMRDNRLLIGAPRAESESGIVWVYTLDPDCRQTP